MSSFAYSPFFFFFSLQALSSWNVKAKGKSGSQQRSTSISDVIIRHVCHRLDCRPHLAHQPTAFYSAGGLRGPLSLPRWAIKISNSYPVLLLFLFLFLRTILCYLNNFSEYVMGSALHNQPAESSNAKIMTQLYGNSPRLSKGRFAHLFVFAVWGFRRNLKGQQQWWGFVWWSPSSATPVCPHPHHYYVEVSFFLFTCEKRVLIRTWPCVCRW